MPASIVISETVAKSVPSVPVPPVPSIATVTSWYVATDKVAVNVKSDASSPTLLALDDKVTVGAESESLIVKVTRCVPDSEAVPPLTPEISITADSAEAASYKLSAEGVKFAVAEVSPVEIVISGIVV